MFYPLLGWTHPNILVTASAVGGASFALECGLSPDLIKSQGDWKSGAYQSYLDPSLSCRSKVANRLGEEFRRLFPVSL